MDTVNPVEAHYIRMIGFLAELLARTGVTMTPDKAYRFGQALLNSAAAEGIDPGAPATFDNASIAAMIRRFTDEITMKTASAEEKAHHGHDELAEVLKEEPAFAASEALMAETL